MLSLKGSAFLQHGWKCLLPITYSQPAVELYHLSYSNSLIMELPSVLYIYMPDKAL